MAELRPGPGPEPGAPALDLVSCSPGQQLEGRGREGRQQGKDSAETSGGEFFSGETEK